MKKNTAYFSAAVLKKDITRFAPLWVLYTIFLLIYVVSDSFNGVYYSSYLPAFMGIMAGVNLVYAFLCAQCLFGDLYKSRLCNVLHAMPLRREGWFLTHCLSGLLLCLIPNGLCTVCLVLLELPSRFALLWLAATVMQYLFFFGLGVLCTMCSGNMLGSTAFYTLANCVTYFLTLLAQLFYAPLLYGTFVIEELTAANLLARLLAAHYLNLYRSCDPSIPAPPLYAAEDWRLLGFVCAAGVVLLALALVLYRRRKLECAGNFIAFKGTAWIFLLPWTLLWGAGFYALSQSLIKVLSVCLCILGMALGFFSGKMLLERQMNVFRWKSIITFAVFAAVFGASLAFAHLDPLDLSTYVPPVNSVAEVRISVYKDDSDNSRYTVTNTEEIDIVTQAHKHCVENPTGEDDFGLLLCYTLKSGISFKRYYPMDVQSEAARQLEKVYSNPDYIFGTADRQAMLESTYMMKYTSQIEEIPDFIVSKQPHTATEPVIYVTDFASNENILALIQAIEDACAEGSMGQFPAYHPYRQRAGTLTIYYLDDSGENAEVTIYISRVNTAARRVVKQIITQ